MLNDITITATPTGIANTGNPFAIFQPTSPTAGATEAVSYQGEPLLPTQTTGSGMTGGTVRLGAPQSLINAGVVGAVAAAAILMGRLPL